MMYIFHPIFFRIMLIIISLIVSIFVFKINVSWFFFLIMLVFLGGVIILIIYINTLAINEKFFLIRKNFSFIFFSGGFIFIFCMIKNTFYKVNLNNSARIIIYENINIYVIIFLILYLLLTLICVVKLIKFEYGPLIKRL